ncbi:MAG: TetR/AcrR family transcriptional regulator [Campylobacter sp.]
MAMKISNRGTKRQEKFIQVGLDIFLEKGYEDTSLTDVIEKSGGSLASIYKFFKNKEGLFQAIVERGFDEFCTEIESKINLANLDKIDEFLTKFATIFFDIICEKKTTLITRIMMSEGAKNGGALGKMFAEQILSKVDTTLVRFFEKPEIKSQLNPQLNPQLAATLFAAIIRSPYHYNAVLLNDDIILSKKERIEHVRTCIDLFLNGILKR